MTVLKLGDRVQLTAAALASGCKPAELGTIYRWPNSRGRTVKVLWDTHGSRNGLYVARDLLEPAASSAAGPDQEQRP